MTSDIALTLAIILMALVLFATERLRVDVIALLVLLAVALTGLISPEQVFTGFANPAVITVWAVYIVSGGLFKTGVADRIGRFILRMAGANETRLIAVIMLTCGVLSAFMNNVGATAMLLPAVIGISRRTKVPASKLLIPLSFSSLMGGGMTLIGTPANILATNILIARGLPSFGFFDFTPIGIAVLATGVLYMTVIGRRLLPDRENPSDQRDLGQLREYISNVAVLPDSPLAGKTLYESGLGATYDLTVLSIIRDGVPLIGVHRDVLIEPDDHLVVEGRAENLLAARDALNLKIEPDQDLELTDISPERTDLFEATLAPRSQLVGRSLRGLRFRDRFGFTALAIWRQGEVITERLRDVRLAFGDALLLQGPTSRLMSLQDGNQFLVLEPIALESNRRRKGPLATGILGLVIGLVVIARLEISTAMVLGSVLMVLTGCLSMDEAYESIDWRTVFLVAGMLPLGLAMEQTGTARYLADLLLDAVGNYGPMALLAGIYILAALITQPMSNAAAMVLIVPIAIDTALSQNLNHLTFTMAAVIGAATSFLTPVGHKANVLVFGPGGYKFFDYTRVGALLTIALLIVSLIFIPLIWPF
jgi:di/tricarboxylate transporter